MKCRTATNRLRAGRKYNQCSN